MHKVPHSGHRQRDPTPHTCFLFCKGRLHNHQTMAQKCTTQPPFARWDRYYSKPRQNTGIQMAGPPKGAAYLVCDTSTRIIDISDTLLSLTGYTRDEVLKKSPSIFQGPDTDKTTIQRINDAVRNGETCITEIVNYTKDRVPFLSVLEIQRPRKGVCIAVHTPLTWFEAPPTK